MSSVLKPAYLHAAEPLPLSTCSAERYLRAESALLSRACDAATAFLRVTLAQPDINIRPLTDHTLQDWCNLPDNANYFMWHQQINLHPDNGYFGFALYHDALLCGMTLNTFVERPLAGGQTNDVMMELVEKYSGPNPLSGYVLSALCEASRTFASLGGADRLVIFSIDSASVMEQFPHMGFARAATERCVNAVLDLRQKDRIDWPRFLQYRPTGNVRTCSPQNLSI